MDAQSFLEIATVVTKLKMYPYFDICNYILMSLMVRDDSHPQATGGQQFSRKHPWSCWISTMVLCFSAGIVSNILLGKAPISVFEDHQAILTATIVWYLVNYSPFDVVYKVTKIKPIKLVIYTMKEIQRTNKISKGVAGALELYPGGYAIAMIMGVVKGAGYYYIRWFERLIRGVWQPASNEFLTPSFVTKGSLLTAIVFILERKGIIDAPHAVVYACVACFFIYFRLMAILVNFTDPFAPIENLFCAVFMGGMWDALRRAVTKESDPSAVKGGANGGAKVTAKKSSEDKKNE